MQYYPMRKKRIPRPQPQKPVKPVKKARPRWIIPAIAAVCVLILAVSFLLLLRGKTSRNPVSVLNGPGGQRVGANAPGAVPVIISAGVLPDKATAETPLYAQYAFAADDQSASFRFRWYANDSVLDENQSGTLEPGEYRKGDMVSFEITPVDRYGQGKPYRSEARKIEDTAPAVMSVALSPLNAVPGDVVTSRVTGSDLDGDSITYSYRWYVNAEPVNGILGEGATFDTRGLRKKDTISLVVTPSDGEKTGKQGLAEGIVLYNSPPRITSSPPATFTPDDAYYTYQVTAVDPDGDRLTYSLEKAPPGMTIDAASGFIRWELPKDAVERREVPIKIKVDDGDGGIVFQEYSFFVQSMP